MQVFIVQLKVQVIFCASPKKTPQILAKGYFNIHEGGNGEQ